MCWRSLARKSVAAMFSFIGELNTTAEAVATRAVEQNRAHEAIDVSIRLTRCLVHESPRTPPIQPLRRQQ